MAIYGGNLLTGGSTAQSELAERGDDKQVNKRSMDGNPEAPFGASATIIAPE